MLKKWLFYISITIIFSTCLSCKKDRVLTDEQQKWLQQQDTITVAIYPYHPPYQILDDKGFADGIFTEYLELIEQKIGYKFHKKIYTTWPKVMDDAREEKIDVIVEIQPTQQRKPYLNFYAFLFESPHVIVTQKKYSAGLNLSDLKDKTVILPKDYAITEILIDKYPNLDFVIGGDDLDCLQKLNSGLYDFYIGPKAVVHYLIKIKNLDQLKIAGETDFVYKPGIAVLKKNKELNAIMAKAINNISRSEKKAVLDNWTYNLITPFYQKTIFWVILSLTIIACLLIILAINRYLKFKIKQKTQELILAKESAEESDRLKTNFIRSISHEIRTPMNGIVGFSEFLNDPELTEEERKKYTRIVINSGKQLMSIVEDILEISKLKSKQVKVHVEKTNLIVLLNALFSVFESKAKEKNISFSLENGFPDHQNLVLIDKSKTKQDFKESY